MNKLKVVVADDHPYVLNGICTLIEQFEELEVIGKAASGVEAYQLIKDNKVDILVTDFEMPHMNGQELIERVNQTHPFVRIIVLSMHNEAWLIKRLMRRRVSAILSKSAKETEFGLALESLKKGDFFMDSIISEQVGNETNQSDINRIEGEPENLVLTNREIQVMQLIYEGYSTKEISEKIHKSLNTIETHRRNLFLKCDVKNIAGLIRFGIQKGYVEI